MSVTAGIAAMIHDPVGRPSTRAVRFWTLDAIVGWAFLAALQVLWMWLGNLWTNPYHLGGLALTVLVAIIHASIMPRWRYSVHRWEVTDDAIFVRSGWLTQETRVAPISRLQTVDSRRGFLSRIMGLTTIKITTASSAGALTIHALDDAVAEEVVARLAAIAQENAGDAT
ncbi:MAG TPA: PH domain-containing protein [Galbitalea sp.]|nr:PH domain-containing protein [Galbitalea sp.]